MAPHFYTEEDFHNFMEDPCSKEMKMVTECEKGWFNCSQHKEKLDRCYKWNSDFYDTLPIDR